MTSGDKKGFTSPTMRCREHGRSQEITPIAEDQNLNKQV